MVQAETYPGLKALLHVQAVQPKLEAMEAAWYRLHSISGAATPDQVIAYWDCKFHTACSVTAAFDLSS